VAEPALVGPHEEILLGLWRAAGAGRLPHALLFHGPEGIGKFAAARRLAQGLLCRAGPGAPCQSCDACKKVVSDNHLDQFVLDIAHEEVSEDRRKDRIGIDRIVRRQGPSSWDGPVIEEFLGLRAAEGGWRTILVREAERLQHSQNEAQNSLLKMLEEPGAQVLWVLESAHPDALLPTVRSRCVPVRFEPLVDADVLAVLARHGVDGAEADQLARWSRGSPGRALALRERGALALRPALEAILAGRTSPLEGADALWLVEGEFRGRSPTARAREKARAVLDLAAEVLVDLLRNASGAPAQALSHGDLSGSVGPGSGPRLRYALEAVLAARADLERNLDPTAVVDAALLALAPGPASAGAQR
jgi:DNA polymerase-3 subunit delta'